MLLRFSSSQLGNACLPPAPPHGLTIEREPERGIEVELRALVPGLLPRLLAKGRAGVVEVKRQRDRDGRVESGGSAERQCGPRETRRSVGVAL